MSPVNQQVARSLVPIALIPAALDPIKPQVLHPRLAELGFIRCQTSLKSLIYRANFRNYVRVTYSEYRESWQGIEDKGHPVEDPGRD